MSHFFRLKEKLIFRGLPFLFNAILGASPRISFAFSLTHTHSHTHTIGSYLFQNRRIFHGLRWMSHEKWWIPHESGRIPHEVDEHNMKRYYCHTKKKHLFNGVTKHECGVRPHEKVFMSHESGWIPHESGWIPHESGWIPHESGLKQWIVIIWKKNFFFTFLTIRVDPYPKISKFFFGSRYDNAYTNRKPWLSR
jgi:hypothetical protein